MGSGAETRSCPWVIAAADAAAKRSVFWAPRSVCSHARGGRWFGVRGAGRAQAWCGGVPGWPVLSIPPVRAASILDAEPRSQPCRGLQQPWSASRRGCRGASPGVGVSGTRCCSGPGLVTAAPGGSGHLPLYRHRGRSSRAGTLCHQPPGSCPRPSPSPPGWCSGAPGSAKPLAAAGCSAILTATAPRGSGLRGRREGSPRLRCRSCSRPAGLRLPDPAPRFLPAPQSIPLPARRSVPEPKPHVS